MEELQTQIDDLRRLISQVRDDMSKMDISYRQRLRLNNALQGDKTYYVATGATGVTQTPLTFKDGILDSES